MGSTRLHGFCVCIAKCDSTATLVCGAADANSTTAIMVVITSVQTRCAANANGQAVVSWASADLSRHRHTVDAYITCCDQCKAAARFSFHCNSTKLALEGQYIQSLILKDPDASVIAEQKAVGVVGCCTHCHWPMTMRLPTSIGWLAEVRVSCTNLS